MEVGLWCCFLVNWGWVMLSHHWFYHRGRTLGCSGEYVWCLHILCVNWVERFIKETSYGYWDSYDNAPRWARLTAHFLLRLCPPLEATSRISSTWLPTSELRPWIQEDVLLYYPGRNKAFRIQTEASNLQMGNVICQDNKPVAFFLHKPNPTR